MAGAVRPALVVVADLAVSHGQVGIDAVRMGKKLDAALHFLSQMKGKAVYEVPGVQSHKKAQVVKLNQSRSPELDLVTFVVKNILQLELSKMAGK